MLLHTCTLSTCPTGRHKYELRKSMVAALAWVPWVPRNPWNFIDGFRNPLILKRLSSKSNKTKHLKYKFFTNQGFFSVLRLYSPLSFEQKYFWNPWIWNPNAATDLSMFLAVFFSYEFNSNWITLLRIRAIFRTVAEGAFAPSISNKGS